MEFEQGVLNVGEVRERAGWERFNLTSPVSEIGAFLLHQRDHRRCQVVLLVGNVKVVYELNEIPNMRQRHYPIGERRRDIPKMAFQ